MLLQRRPRAFLSWFLTTSFIEVGLLILLGILFGLFIWMVVSTDDIGLAYTFLCLPLLAIMGGLLIGWTQYRVLRQHNTRSCGWLALAGLVSWIVGGIGLLIFLFSFTKPLIKLYTDSALSMADATFRRMLLSLAGVGAIGGAIKGGVLAWLLHPSRK